MIVVKLWGGMGNQMFQYAFGLALANKYGDELRFDTEWYSNQPQYTGKRKIEIENNYNLSSFSVVHRPKSVKVPENKLVSQVTRRIPNFHCATSKNTLFVKEWQRHYMESLPYKPGRINYYDGYWLTEEYFKDIKDIIRKEFTPKDEIQKVIMPANVELAKDNSVSVHIRRGDYTKRINMPSGYNEESLMDYYMRAIQYMKDHVENPQFYFFSDDIEWCKNTFGSEEDMVYLSRKIGYPAMADLFGIGTCKHGIMSPSTFSWWGNWLREDENGSVVVLPKGAYANTRFARPEWTVL